MRRWSASTPGYAEMIQDIRDALAYAERSREPMCLLETGEKPTVAPEDECRIDSVQVKLSLGSRILPSKKFDYKK